MMVKLLQAMHAVGKLKLFFLMLNIVEQIKCLCWLSIKKELTTLTTKWGVAD